MRVLFFIIIFSICFTVNAQQNDRITKIQNQLEIMATNNPGLTERINNTIGLNNVTLSNFLLAVSNVHKVNINVGPTLSNITISNNFSDVSVASMLLFICKEYNLTIEFTDNILSVKAYEQPPEEIKEHPISVNYDFKSNTVAIDVRQNRLYDVFKAIMDASSKNLLFAPGMDEELLTSYIMPTDFDAAMDKLALANNLIMTKTKDNFYVFDRQVSDKDKAKPNLTQRLQPGLNFEILNKPRKLINVDLTKVRIVDVINAVGDSLEINRFTAAPLEEAGEVTFRAKNITFDELLVKLFEPQTKVETLSADKNASSNARSSSNTNNAELPKEVFTFKKEGNIYFFGTEKQLTVRKVEIITLNHRSVEILDDPTLVDDNSNVRDNFVAASNSFRNQSVLGFRGNQPQTNDPRVNAQRQDDGERKTILDIIPEEVKTGLDFKVDTELNSIYVTGTGARIEFFRQFIQNIDKTIPVILIEVMIVEASVSNTVEAGVTWGIGDEPATTQGSIFPTTDITLNSQTINKIIGGFSSTSAFNFGKVIPNFFATIKAMETNGDLKIKSTPKLATLNGHRAHFSNGQTSYYAIVQRNVIGTDNPQTSELTNYFPIDAKLGLTIKPYVTGDKDVMLDINVIQSSFGNRIAEDAPPDINSRNFSSIVRMEDQDIAVLGGLEENFKNNSGSGVPFLARIPVIKWLFSKRVREARKSKLTVFIKPTVIN